MPKKKNMAAKRAKAPRRRMVREGPVGLCPCCGKRTEVQIASTLGEQMHANWIVPMPLLEMLYRSVALRIKHDQKKNQWYVTDPNEYDATRRSKLFFVDGGSGGGIAGPFGYLGLKVFLRTGFGDTPYNIRVYIVATSHRALDRIRNSPFARPPKFVDDLDEIPDLF